MSDLWDAHSHHLGKNKCFNLDWGNHEAIIQIQKVNYVQIVSLGHHPWNVGEFSISEFLRSLDHLFGHPNIKVGAIGEIGLDRIRGGAFSSQIETFRSLIKVAKNKNLPIVLHAVKSVNDVLGILKEEKFEGKCLFHGVNGSKEELASIISNGHYIGVGNLVRNPKAKLTRNLERLPIKQILLESDELSNKALEDVYNKCSTIFDITHGELVDQMARNFHHFFELS